ncbi:MAG: hypothetical protein HYZ44_02035 [Bacteroidetes bacterium]|nr:hypothetical protein [Bacteroidota bacterium]
MRSFDLVDFKIAESEYFLKRITRSKDMFEVQFLFSAYVSAMRSVTFCIQASLSDLDGFALWYESKQRELKNDPLAKFFLQARNLSQKVGVVPISSGSYSKGKALYYFDCANSEFANPPKEDVATACVKYLKVILRVVYDCYVDFGTTIDPHQYYTKTNYAKLGKAIEDLDEQMTGIRGYTGFVNWPEEYRWQAYRNSVPGCRISSLFPQYLGLHKPHPPSLPNDPKEFDGISWVPPCLQE